MRAAVLALCLTLTGCATIVRHDLYPHISYPAEDRFFDGASIAFPGFILGVAGWGPGWPIFVFGWALGMSGAIEGCAMQGGC